MNLAAWFFKILKTGWHVITETHTLVWLLGLTGIPISAIPVWLGWYTLQNRAVLFGIAVFTWAVFFVCVLAYYGYKAQGPKSQRTFSSPQPTPEFISMKEAATRLYESSADFSGMPLREAAEKLGGRDIGSASPAERLDYLATFLSGKTAVFGRKPPDRQLKQIDSAEVKRAFFSDGATMLRDRFYDKSIYWEDLCVKTRDLHDFIARLSSPIPSHPALSVPQPTIRIDEVAQRITDKPALPSSAEPESMDSWYACEQLREKVLLGVLHVFGGVDWRTTRPADYDRMIRAPIPREYWRNHRIDVIGLLDQEDRRGRTLTLAGEFGRNDYYGIWFDKNEIDALWPPKS